MKTDLIGLCARCLKRHSGKCALALGLTLFVADVYDSTKHGIPHDQVRPMVVFSNAASATSLSADAQFTIIMRNTTYPGPDYSGPSPLVWQIVKRTLADERPVPPVAQTVQPPKAKEPDKA